MPHLPGNVDDLIKSDVSTVLNVSLLLSVPWWFLEGFDDKGRSRRYHLNLGLSALNGQFHCNPQTLPITSCLSDVITDLFWRQAQGADLGDQSRRGTDFPTGAPQVHDFDLIGVELRRHGGGGWWRMNPDSGRPRKLHLRLLRAESRKLNLLHYCFCFMFWFFGYKTCGISAP